MAKLESYIKAEVSLQPETESELQQRHKQSHVPHVKVGPRFCNARRQRQDQVDCSKERHADGEGWKNLIANTHKDQNALQKVKYRDSGDALILFSGADVQMSEEGSSSPYSPSRKTADSARQASHSAPQSRVIELDGIPCIYPGAFSKALVVSAPTVLTFSRETFAF
eukprot:763865-Hanusia_phi.AAC.2